MYLVMVYFVFFSILKRYKIVVKPPGYVSMVRLGFIYVIAMGVL